MRIFTDPTIEHEAFIPMNNSPRSMEIARQTIQAIEDGSIVDIAARYLAEHDPTNPTLLAYLHDAEDFDG